MKPRFNWELPVGLLMSVATFLSFRFAFVKWPITRDVPWANLLLFAAAVTLLWRGLRRAFMPGRRRLLRAAGGTVVALVSAAALALFVFTVLIAPRDLPPSGGAPRVGEKAPDFTMLDINGVPVTLGTLLSEPMPSASSAHLGSHPPKGVLLIFYMYRQCLACNSELHDMQTHVADFDAMGIRPVAISNDAPEVTRELRRDAGYTYTFLSDRHSDTIRRYDLLNADGLTARPADVLIDATGTVRWRLLTNDYYVRARPEQVLAAATLLP